MPTTKPTASTATAPAPASIAAPAPESDAPALIALPAAYAAHFQHYALRLRRKPQSLHNLRGEMRFTQPPAPRPLYMLANLTHCIAQTESGGWEVLTLSASNAQPLSASNAPTHYSRSASTFPTYIEAMRTLPNAITQLPALPAL